MIKLSTLFFDIFSYVFKKLVVKFCSMGMIWRLIIDFFKSRLDWDSRKKVEKDLTILRERILKSKKNN